MDEVDVFSGEDFHEKTYLPFVLFGCNFVQPGWQVCNMKIVVGMMRAFGSMGGVGPSLFCPRSCPAVACDHEASRAMTGQWW